MNPYVDPRYVKGSDGATIACIEVVIEDELRSVPISDDNMHYREMMRLAAAGELTIADAEQ